MPAKQGVRLGQLWVCSRGAAELAAAELGPDSDAVLLALLHRATDWLGLAATPRPTAPQSQHLLPGWLATALERLRRPRSCPPGSIEAVAAAAIATSRASSAAAEPFAIAPAGLAALLNQLAHLAAERSHWTDDFERAVEHAKLEALKEFAYGAGHEINNPLANISARAQTLLKDETDPERRQKLAAINTQAFRAMR